MGNSSVFTDPGYYEGVTERECVNLSIVLGAYRSFVGHRKNTAYVSVPITSGRRLFEAMRRNGVGDFKSLEGKIGKGGVWEEVIKPNIEDGARTAQIAMSQHDGIACIVPSVFEAKKWRWSQDAYMALWYRVLGEKAGLHLVAENWEYSVGCAKEVLMSMFMQWDLFRSCLTDYWYREFMPFAVRPSGNDAASLASYHEQLDAMRQIQVIRTSGPLVGYPFDISSVLMKMVVAIKNLREWGLDYVGLLNVAMAMASIPGSSRIRNADERAELMCHPVWDNAFVALNEIFDSASGDKWHFGIPRQAQPY